VSKESLQEALPLWTRVLRELGSFALVAVILWFSFTKMFESLEKIQNTESKIIAFLEQQTKVLDKLEARLTLLESRGK
jgi:uncharacterized membrane protein